jgi:hypothetical protein
MAVQSIDQSINQYYICSNDISKNIRSVAHVGRKKAVALPGRHG